jgi:hypothetical protein
VTKVESWLTILLLDGLVLDGSQGLCCSILEEALLMSLRGRHRAACLQDLIEATMIGRVPFLPSPLSKIETNSALLSFSHTLILHSHTLRNPLYRSTVVVNLALN